MSCPCDFSGHGCYCDDCAKARHREMRFWGLFLPLLAVAFVAAIALLAAGGR